MAHRKPKVPTTAKEVVRLLERPDVTAQEQHAALVGAILVCADAFAAGVSVQKETSTVTSKMLDILLKQHGTLLLDLTDPPVEVKP